MCSMLIATFRDSHNECVCVCECATRKSSAKPTCKLKRKDLWFQTDAAISREHLCISLPQLLCDYINNIPHVIHFPRHPLSPTHAGSWNNFPQMNFLTLIYRTNNARKIQCCFSFMFTRALFCGTHPRTPTNTQQNQSSHLQLRESLMRICTWFNSPLIVRISRVFALFIHFSLLSFFVLVRKENSALNDFKFLSKWICTKHSKDSWGHWACWRRYHGL